MKKFFVFLLVAFTSIHCLFSEENIFNNPDQEILININKKDQTSDKNKSIDNTSDNKERQIGNIWYSRKNLYFYNNTDIGFSGTKDYISEQFLFSYRFTSKIKHAFSFRLYHLGYTSGMFTGNFKFYNFGVMAGFEYLYKIFSNISGFFIWSDFGACNGGYAFNFGLGVGSRANNGFEMDVTYLHNTGVFGRLDFYFLFIDLITIHGRFGIDYKFYDLQNEIFTFFPGLYFGFFIKNIFKIELGGGITLNEFSFIRGFGSIALVLNLL